MTTHSCWVEIRTRALENNFRFLMNLAAPHVELLAVVKDYAYGHSLKICAPAVEHAGARWLGVARVDEGVRARALCPAPGVLVMCGALPGEGAAAVEHRLSVVAWQPWQLDELESAARTADRSIPVHLEIDTGMSRQGVAPEEFNPEGGKAGALLARFHPESPLRLEAVMTHLFAADEADGRVTAKQMTLLEELLGRITAAGVHPEWLHVGNSAALLAGQAAQIAALAVRYGMKAMVRPGMALYGLTPRFDPQFEPSKSPEPESLTAARAQLQPVLAWKTRVVGVRTVPAGAVVGYNGTFVATEPMRLALVAAGYADGLDRRLGNRFCLLVRGQRAPLVGRVSMDSAVLDVTEIDGVEPGDEVVILGEQGGETITAFDHAEATGTIPWEVFTRIGASAPRIAV
jgi:alanine racemase